MQGTKRELRQQIARQKSLYSKSELTKLSAPIITLLESHPLFLEAKVVLLYHSLADEVCTHPFIEHWSARKTILLPLVSGEQLELRVYSSANLRPGSFGILEPTGSALFTAYDQIDLAVVPGVAFDRKGNRLGRGKGYYDRLLPQLKAPRIGICFPFQLVDEVPAEPTDTPMDEVICG
jgi:5-formyltetrahydrofolate cyclo-ligase